ncbi:MAG: signal recognition particle protein [Candidatus Dadabacteria bacterium]|nr:signal recognition particle protein [Candidatus Dadabacteria bacterium]NIY22777.1 signal recognition particle protein [Candidatus Dadabacteria bacterium]
MFEGISEKLANSLKEIRGTARISEDNIKDTLREVRLNLLEADVNFQVVKGFIDSVRARALGAVVGEKLNPGQQFVKIVNEELIKVLGEATTEVDLHASPPVVFMLVGLQGSGKTTSIAKLAKYLRETHKRNPYLVPADIYRPAAIDQLKVLADSEGFGVFDSSADMKPVDICNQAREAALTGGYDVMLIDTAGRLHIDEELMNELVELKGSLNPQNIYFVADAMTGQDAVTVASSFNDTLDITGVILTKMDGDARGGAAMSIKSVTGKPIMFFGTGEKLDALEVFHPDRIASRILGMGDVLTFIEKAQDVIEEEKAEKMAKKILKNRFSLGDFKESMLAMKKMGSLEEMAGMVPGIKDLAKNPKAMNMAEKEIDKTIAIINSMTKKERRDHTIINGSRRKRIANGSGTSVPEVNRMMKNYAQMRKMMKNMGKMGKLAQRLMKF